jgi:uncharacterized protein
MLFKSRKQLTLREKVRLLVWPRVSWVRSGAYVFKRVLRMKASPHRIAIGCAAGVFASITPLIGVQMVMAGAIALILRGSVPAAMLATFAGNPFSWPLIWGTTYALGHAIIGQPGAAEAAAMIHNQDTVWPVLFAMLVGSIPIGLVSAAVSYGVVERVVSSTQQSGIMPADRLVAWRTQALDYISPTWRLW